MRSGSVLSLTLATVLSLAASAVAQPSRDHRAPAPPGGGRDHRTPPAPPEPTPPPPATAGPTEAPPAPRAENPGTKAGYVWMAGHWDWKHGKWDWTDGRWERERAGKEWHQGHWDPHGSSWSFTEGAWADHAGPGDDHPGDDHPHEAPPAPHAENPGTKAGYVWIAGQWDWKAGKWDWTDGHWERERAGKTWRPTRWEQQNGAYARVDGDWVDASAAPPPPGPDQPPPGAGHHHHEWKLERPTVSSYWPTKGKVGTRVAIKGQNFPAGAMVVWAGAPVRGAKVTPDKITFAVPEGAVSGDIALRRDGGRDLSVGAFEVAADVDAAAEQKKLDDEARAKAEAAWAAREKELAKDHAARQTAYDQKQQQLEQSRDQRRADRVTELRAKWDAAFLADPDTQDELTLHAQRVADIQRMRDVAELSADGKLAVRIDMAETREQQRHDQRMAALHDAFGKNGGHP